MFSSFTASLKKVGNDAMKLGEQVVADASKVTAQIGQAAEEKAGILTQLDAYCSFAAETLSDCLSGKHGQDLAIPLPLIQRAKALVFLSEYKAGFLLTVKGGVGLMVKKKADGTWTNPVALGVGGLATGLQIGASSIHSILLLNTDAAIGHFQNDAHVSLGAGVSVAAGPIGRDAQAQIELSNKKPAPIYAYSLSRGLFAGVSINGAVVAVDHPKNQTFYGARVSVVDIFEGKAVVPESHDGTTRLLTALANMMPVSTPEGKELPSESKETEETPAPPVVKPAAEPADEVKTDETAPTQPEEEEDLDAPKPKEAEEDLDAPKPKEAEEDLDAPKPEEAEEDLDAPKPQ
jgi:lipid-binding SYLF domain-containing protein